MPSLARYEFSALGEQAGISPGPFQRAQIFELRRRTKTATEVGRIVSRCRVINAILIHGCRVGAGDTAHVQPTAADRGGNLGSPGPTWRYPLSSSSRLHGLV